MSGPRASPDGILAWARELQAIAQNGLTFTRDTYDRERYLKLQELAARMLAAELDISPAQAQHYWEGEEGYATPKVDVRGGVFDGERVLLVRELTGGAPLVSHETDAVAFFPVRELPELSTGRVLAPQIERLYRHRLNPALPTDFD